MMRPARAFRGLGTAFTPFVRHDDPSTTVSLIVAAFDSSLLNDQRAVNSSCGGLAVAIVIDATLIRLVLLRAVMAIARRGPVGLPGGRRPPSRIHAEPPQLDPFEAEFDPTGTSARR
jgi:putative drug exporter of the RND superfamily